MNIRSRRPRRATRRPRRRATRRPRRGVYTGSKLINRVYNYIMAPETQYLTNTNVLGGLSVPNAAVGAPLQLTNFLAPSPAQSGFPGYYDTGFGMSFKLTNLANYLAFANIYDNWRLNYVTITITFMSNTANAAGVSVLPTCYWFVDQDDAITPTNIQSISSRQGYKKHHFGKNQTLTIRIKPRAGALMLNARTGSAQASQAKYGQWMDCQNNGSTTDYFGLKVWFTDLYLPDNSTAPGGNTGIKFDYKYNVSFKAPFNEY